MSDKLQRRELPASGVCGIMLLFIFISHRVHMHSDAHEWLPDAWTAILALVILIMGVQFFFDLRARRRKK